MAATLPPSPVPRQARTGRAHPLRVLVLCLAAVLPPASPASAESLTRDIYTVLFAPGREKTARFVLDRAAGAMGELERDLGGRYDWKVTIVILDRKRGEGDTAPPEGMPGWFAGA